jgi:hypothetical protein
LVVWDGLPAHRARLVSEFIRTQQARPAIEWLPGYAPELNPVEYIWGYRKHHELPNLCPRVSPSSAIRRAARCAACAGGTHAWYDRSGSKLDCHYAIQVSISSPEFPIGLFVREATRRQRGCTSLVFRPRRAVYWTPPPLILRPPSSDSRSGFAVNINLDQEQGCRKQASDLYKHPEQYDREHLGDEEDIGFYLSLSRSLAPRKILELDCGTGRITLPLAQLGFDVVGLDNQPEMLQKADARRLRSSAETRRRLQFIEADLRTWSAHSNFDLILIPASSISHVLSLEDQLAMSKRCHDNLRPEGRLLIEITMPNM